MERDVLLDRRLAFAFLRITLGLNILMHGAVRLPILSVFVAGLVKEFAKTPLPEVAVKAFAYSLPFEEGLVGLFVLVGLWTRNTLLLGASIMAALVFGTALLSDWNTLGIQMLYVVIYAALLALREYNEYSLDGLITPRGCAPTL
jgi:thiosulfate dehydrogenase [quinone] large subunit